VTVPATIETLEVLHQILVELKALRADLARDRDLPCHPDDAQFLAIVAAAVADRVFNASELRNHALVDEALRCALGNLSVQQVGIKLRALAGRDIGGHVVRRVGRDGDGVLWEVVQQLAPDLHAAAGIGAARGA
jgi:hypothetical protein